MTHSPTPWTFDSTLNVIRDEERSIVGDIYLGQDTDLTLEAVNSHASNLALITELVGALSNLLDDAESHQDGDDRSFTLDVTCSRAREVLARAKASHGART